MKRRALALVTAALLATTALSACGEESPEAVDASPTPTATAPVDDGLLIAPEYSPSIGREPVEVSTPAEEEPAEGDEGDAENGEAEVPERDPAVVACETLSDVWNRTNQALSGISFTHPRALTNAFDTAAITMAAGEPMANIAQSWDHFLDYLATVREGFVAVDRDDINAVADALEAAVTNEDTEAASAEAELITQFIADGCP